MRLVDETLILQNLECLQESPWYNDGKDPESGRRWQFNIRKEAAEIVRDLCIRPVPTVDAIPVRWIQGKIGYMQCKGNPWTAESLEWLLKAWAQENGHGKG